PQRLRSHRDACRFRSGSGRTQKGLVRHDLLVKKCERPRRSRGYLLESLQPLAADLGLEGGEARQIAAGLSEALDEAAADRIADLDEHFGNPAIGSEQRRQEVVA